MKAKTVKNHTRRYRAFLKRMREARQKAGLSQEQVAALLGTSQSFVSRSETGARRVDIVELQAFAEAYKCTIDLFLREGVL